MGKRSALFVFDEDVETYLDRAAGLGMDLRPYVKEGLINLQEIRVGEISRGELSQIIRRAVEEDEVKLIVIDSLTGYHNAMMDEHMLLAQMYKMLAYMRSHGVFTILVVSEHGLVGGAPEPHSITLLADTVILLRYFEADGLIRRALAIFKKRFGDHDRTIREMTITSEGIKVRGPLEGFTGVLIGVPAFHENRAALEEPKNDADART
jgi:circadian clock protein KaiC